MPTIALQPLAFRPRLASWEAAGHPSQIRLKEFLSEAVGLCDSPLGQLPDPVACRLDVGLPEFTPLLAQHDLDNYLFPLVTQLSRASGRSLASVWGTKRHSPDSYFGVSAAVPADPEDSWPFSVNVHTTASASTAAYKEEIDQQLAGVRVLPEGPLRVHIGFVVGTRRN